MNLVQILKIKFGSVLSQYLGIIQQANKGTCKRSKYIRIHKSYLWEQTHVFNSVRVAKIDTAENSADLQTKVLDSTKFEKHAKTIMGMNESLTVNVVELKFYKLD